MLMLTICYSIVVLCFFNKLIDCPNSILWYHNIRLCFLLLILNHPSLSLFIVFTHTPLSFVPLTFPTHGLFPLLEGEVKLDKRLRRSCIIIIVIVVATHIIWIPSTHVDCMLVHVIVIVIDVRVEFLYQMWALVLRDGVFACVVYHGLRVLTHCLLCMT